MKKIIMFIGAIGMAAALMLSAGCTCGQNPNSKECKENYLLLDDVETD